MSERTRIQIEVNGATVKRLVIDHLTTILQGELEPEDVEILVKSKQNYKAEWETGEFKAKVDKWID